MITMDVEQRRAYDRLLDTISRPLMGALAGAYEFDDTQINYPDGIQSNFVLKDDAVVQPVSRYLDLTDHVVYLADVLVQTIRDDEGAFDGVPGPAVGL